MNRQRSLYCLSALAALIVSAEAASSAGGAVNQWTNISPNTSAGTVLAIAPAPSDPAIVYVAASGGIFKSTDAGESWTRLTLDLRRVGALAVDPRDPSVVWAGSEGDFVSTAVGLLKSTDGGRTWIPLRGGPGETHVYAIAIDPRSGSTVYVGTAVGVFKTTNGGATWIGLNDGIQPFTDISRLAISPSSPSTIYAGSRYSTGRQGLYRSTDGGASWTSVNGNLARREVWALAVHPTDPDVVYRASIVGPVVGPVAKTTDGGANWEELPSPRGIFVLAIDPVSPETVYAGGSDFTEFGYGLSKTTDGGRTWTLIGTTGLTSRRIVSLAVGTRSVLYAGTSPDQSGPVYSGVFKSVDGGQNWTPAPERFGLPIFDTLEIVPSSPSTLYAGGHESFKSTDGGRTWRSLRIRVLTFAIDPRMPDTVYAGELGVRRSRDGGATWEPATLADIAIADLAVDPTSPSVVYAASSHNGRGVYRSGDGGETWVQVFRFAGDFGAAGRLAIHPADPTTVYLGTNRGLYRSRDRGETWVLLPVSSLSSSIGLVEIDPSDPQVIYTSIGDQFVRNFYKSVDGGSTWTSLQDDFGPDRFIRALDIDPFDTNILFAGTDREVFRSADGGESWTLFDGPLRPSLGVDLAIDPLSPSTIYAVSADIYKASVFEPGRCVADPITLCMNSGRFRARVGWRTPDGKSGQGRAVPITSDTGAFWFFSDNNLELVVKVVDGRPVNGHFWVFSGGLSNVAYEVTIIDTVTNEVRSYVNPQHALASRADTLAFAAESSSADAVEEASPAAQSGCSPDGTAACLNGGRFRVEIAWRVPSQGSEGRAEALSLTGDTSAFWFFTPNNLEVVLKVVDGRAFNGKFWVFFGALSDVEYTITVTDTDTGAVRSYFNPSGTLASAADTSAF